MVVVVVVLLLLVVVEVVFVFVVAPLVTGKGGLEPIGTLLIGRFLEGSSYLMVVSNANSNAKVNALGQRSKDTAFAAYFQRPQSVPYQHEHHVFGH